MRQTIDVTYLAAIRARNSLICLAEPPWVPPAGCGALSNL
jgi:hypothetical protein